MPNRRVHGEGAYAHYITFSCFKRRRLLDPDICKRIVIGRMGAQLASQKVICCGFVVMPNHVHAVVWFPDEFQISLFMSKWKELTSRELWSVYERKFPRYLEKMEGKESIWQPRYYGFNVFSQE